MIVNQQSQLSDWLPAWLTFAGTLILGGVTVYFAYRSRQLEQKQARQINREFDRELAVAEVEAKRAADFQRSWDKLKATTPDLRCALGNYRQIRGTIPPIDFSKISFPLSFHLPQVLEVAESGRQELVTATMLFDRAASDPAINQTSHKPNTSQAEAELAKAVQQFDQVLEAIKSCRATLRGEVGL